MDADHDVGRARDVAIGARRIRRDHGRTKSTR
jgi:hypothetical protein